MDLSTYHTPAGAYAFHTTRAENVPSIRDRGLLCQISCNPDTEATIQTISNHDAGDRLPFDRDAVIYCHLNPTYVEETQSALAERGSPNDERVVVVDVSAVTAPMYVADMDLASDLVEANIAPDSVLVADSPADAIRRYQESIVRVSRPDDIASVLNDDHGHPELVVDGDVPPEAITRILPTAP